MSQPTPAPEKNETYCEVIDINSATARPTRIASMKADYATNNNQVPNAR